jgi:hypothetical protein
MMVMWHVTVTAGTGPGPAGPVPGPRRAGPDRGRDAGRLYQCGQAASVMTCPTPRRPGRAVMVTE